jgi:tetratricopeptide (TPR) repeat protein
VVPYVSLPVGPLSDNYRLGYGTRIEGVYSDDRLPIVSPVIDLAYELVPLDLGERGILSSSNLSLLRGGVGVRAARQVLGTLSLRARAAVSGFYGLLRGDSEAQSTGFSWSAGGGVGFQVSDRLLIDFDVSYRSHVGLHDGVAVSVGFSRRMFGPGAAVTPGSAQLEWRRGLLPNVIRVSEVSLDRVFPAMFKYYDKAPIGTASITNIGNEPVRDVEVRLILRQYMDAPKLSARIDELNPDQPVEVDLFALFREEILEITEGARLAAELVVEAGEGDSRREFTEVFTLEAYDRNALQWDDDMRIGAFVTARDEQIQAFARNIAAGIRDEQIDAINRELQLAAALYAALDIHGSAYVVDPSSPYAELSADALAVDSVQFPQQTLQFRAGDCDDLSATYAALLESVGIQTAFITIPGHIYLAFRLDVDEQEAVRSFARAQDLIVREDGSVWLPVEATVLDQGFMQAWAIGAQQWRQHFRAGDAGFFTTEEAWRRYEPVAFSVSSYQIPPPPTDLVVASFRDEMRFFVEEEIEQQRQPLARRLERDPNHPATRNRLGAIYARYGRLEEAEAHFRVAGRDGSFAPALANLGNVALLRGEQDVAVDYFDQALRIDPDNVAALTGAARARYEAEDLRGAREIYDRLREIAPGASSRLSYLAQSSDDGSRAARQIATVDSLHWGE